MVSAELPAGVWASVVITLARHLGQRRDGDRHPGAVVQAVTIAGAQRVVELLEQCTVDR